MMMVTPYAPERTELPKWEMKVPSTMYEHYSIIDIKMGLGAITFEGEAVATPKGNEKWNGAERLTGNKRLVEYLLEGDSQTPVMKNQEALPEMIDAQMHQSIAAISDDWDVTKTKKREKGIALRNTQNKTVLMKNDFGS